MKKILLVLIMAIMLLSGCSKEATVAPTSTPSPTVEISDPVGTQNYSDVLCGTWKADEFGWIYTYNADGTFTFTPTDDDAALSNYVKGTYEIKKGDDAKDIVAAEGLTVEQIGNTELVQVSDSEKMYYLELSATAVMNEGEAKDGGNYALTYLVYLTSETTGYTVNLDSIGEEPIAITKK